MLSKLKNAVNNVMQAEKVDRPVEQQRKKIDISVINTQEIKIYKKIMQKLKQNIETIQEIGQNNRQDLLQFIKQRAKIAAENGQKQKNPSEDNSQDQKFTFDQDLKQIKQAIQQTVGQLKKIQTIQQQILQKVNQIQNSNHSPGLNANSKSLQQLVNKYEVQIASLRKSEQNNKQILNTLSHQSQLYIKQMRQLQQKCQKLDRDLNDKNILINNLKEQKVVLLQMKNTITTGQAPQMEAMRFKITQFQKRLNLQRSKVQAKQKQIQNLKKKMQQQHESLQKIADQLKQKQLKSKKIIDKYERSKTEIRKFRQQKTQFIKQLNIQVARISDQLAQQKRKNQSLTQQNTKLKQEVQNLKTQVSKNENRKIELQSSQSQLVQVRQQLHQKNMINEQQSVQMKKMKQLNQQLQQKRKQLLQALQKPINHEIRTLQKILKALDKLYKDYITTVFQDGNVVGFQAKITYIISNIQQIKQDLLL